jgi:hypothetical protein
MSKNSSNLTDFLLFAVVAMQFVQTLVLLFPNADWFGEMVFVLGTFVGGLAFLVLWFMGFFETS